MLRRSWRIISWILVLGLIGFAVYRLETYEIPRKALGNGKVEEPKPVAKDQVDKLSDIASYTKVSENDRLVLYYEPVTSSIAVNDKSSGAIWMSGKV